MIAWAATNWHVLDGRWLARGIDVAALPLDRLLNLLHHELLELTDDNRRGMVELQLTAPLDGEGLDAVADDDADIFAMIEGTADDNRPPRR